MMRSLKPGRHRNLFIEIYFYNAQSVDKICCLNVIRLGSLSTLGLIALVEARKLNDDKSRYFYFFIFRPSTAASECIYSSACS